MLSTLKIDKNTPIPLYFQLKELLLREIEAGNYPVGATIPTEMEISEQLAISRTTVRQAITELVQEGWLYRVKSKGTFVAQPKIQQDFIQRLEKYDEQIIRSGKTPATELLECKVIKATDNIAASLQLTVKDKVIFIHRRRFADEEPIVTIKTYIPYDLCNFILDYDLSKNSLYDTLSQKEETHIYYVKRLVEAVAATREDSQHLNIKTGKPIQSFVSTGYNSSDRPIEYSLARYRGDRNSFEITVFPKE